MEGFIEEETWELSRRFIIVYVLSEFIGFLAHQYTLRGNFRICDRVGSKWIQSCEVIH